MYLTYNKRHGSYPVTPEIARKILFSNNVTFGDLQFSVSNPIINYDFSKEGSLTFILGGTQLHCDATELSNLLKGYEKESWVSGSASLSRASTWLFLLRDMTLIRTVEEYNTTTAKSKTREDTVFDGPVASLEDLKSRFVEIGNFARNPLSSTVLTLNCSNHLINKYLNYTVEYHDGDLTAENKRFQAISDELLSLDLTPQGFIDLTIENYLRKINTFKELLGLSL